MDRPREEMKHIPPVPKILDWIGGEYRRKAEVLYQSAFESGVELPPGISAEVQKRFAEVCSWLERVSELLRPHRRIGAPILPLRGHLDAAFGAAVEALAGVPAEEFRRRASHDNFHRSKGEPVFAAVLAVNFHLEALGAVLVAADPDIRMKLNEAIFPEVYRIEMPKQPAVLGNS